MNLLAIETATDACSIALQTGDDVLFDHRIAAQQHAKLTLPMIDALMADAGLAPGDLDGLVFGRGPGSFTGVRIAAAITQGIAFGADLGVLGISTLRAIAQGCAREFDDKQVVAAMDARMGEVYWGAYWLAGDGLMAAITEDAICKPAEVSLAAVPAGQGMRDVNGARIVDDAPSQAMREKQAEWFVAGSGAERYADELLGGISSSNLRTARWPDARDLLSLAVPDVIAGKLRDAAEAVPVYLRDRVALTEAERAQGQRL